MQMKKEKTAEEKERILNCLVEAEWVFISEFMLIFVVCLIILYMCTSAFGDRRQIDPPLPSTETY